MEEEKELKPITAEDIRAVLTEDNFSRKTRCWNLINYNGLLEAYKKHNQVEELDDDVQALFNDGNYRDRRTIKKQTIVPIKDLFYARHSGYLYRYGWRTGKKIREIATFKKFDLCVNKTARNLVRKFPGELILAGGSVRKFITCTSECNDLDFFFICETKERANQILEECVNYVSNHRTYGTYNDEEIDIIEQKNEEYQKITRNSYVTTVINNKGKFQFIHRIYGSIDQVIGGFDLANSAIAYDGNDIYVTPLACFSICCDVEIVNVSRRSTSYEHRLRKYAGVYGLRLIFPGTNLGKIVENDPKTLLKGSSYSLSYFRMMNMGNQRFCTNYGFAKLNKKYVIEKWVSDYEDSATYFNEKEIGVGNLKLAARGKIDAIHTYARESSDLMKVNVVGLEYLFNIDEMIKKFTNMSKSAVTTWFPGDLDRICVAIAKNDRETLFEICTKITVIIRSNFTKAEEKLKEIRWITKNPGRQWTSSNNPIIDKASEWYGEENYVPFYIGVPSEITITLLCMWKRKKCVWKIINRDIFKLIMSYIEYNYAVEGYKVAIGFEDGVVPRSQLMELEKHILPSRSQLIELEKHILPPNPLDQFSSEDMFRYIRKKYPKHAESYLRTVTSQTLIDMAFSRNPGVIDNIIGKKSNADLLKIILEKDDTAAKDIILEGIIKDPNCIETLKKIIKDLETDTEPDIETGEDIRKDN